MASLVPVSQWVYGLYKVEYSIAEGEPPQLTKYFVAAFDNHLEADIQEYWPSSAFHWFQWTLVVDKVSPPRVIGSLYGMPLHESGHEAGMREAEKRGLK